MGGGGGGDHMGGMEVVMVRWWGERCTLCHCYLFSYAGMNSKLIKADCNDD